MKSKPNNSLKRSTRISITTSDALKDWIERYLNKKRKEHPQKKMYSSLSSFCFYSLDKLKQILEKGKTLDDFDRLMDKEVKNYWDPFTVSLSLPFVEPHFEPAIYFETGIQTNLRYYLSQRKLMLENIDFRDIKTGYTAFDRYKKRFFEVGLTKSINIDISMEKKSKNWKVTLEHVGKSKSGFSTKYIFLTHTKALLEAWGILGFKAIDYLILRKDMYCRIDFVSTPLFFQKELRKRERIALMQENIRHLINYNRIISEEEEYHLWMKLAEDKYIFIEFKDIESFNIWINKIKNDIDFYEIEDRSDPQLKILRFFEKLHWIQLIYLDDLVSFNFVKFIPEKIKKLTLDYLNSKFSLRKEREMYYIS